MEESNHAALPMEGAKYLCKKVSCHRHSKNDFKRLVAKKKNFMKLDGRIKPCSLDNGRSKQTEALNDYFSFM